MIKKIDKWDKKEIIRFNGFGGNFFALFLKFISFFGRETIWIFLIAFLLFIWYDPRSFSYIGITFLNGVWINLSVKNMVNRQRPFESLNDINVLGRRPSSRSFPSWHVYNTTSQGLVISLLLQSPLLMILFLGFSITVGFSRIQLGAHYPSDVIVGYFLGIIGAILTIIFFGPLIYYIVTFFEQFSLFKIQYNNFNSLLVQGWYLLLCIIVFGLILFLTIFRKMKNI